MGVLDGQVAFITGAARGQGRSHAAALACEGADIVAVDLCGPLGTDYDGASPEELDITRGLVESAGRRCIACRADVRDLDAMNGVVRQAISELGGIDILVANAGILHMTPIVEMSGEQWARVIDTNLTGVFNSIRATLPHMIERKRGCIIGISSMAAKTPAPNFAHYVASKFGVVGLLKATALEAAPFGVRANVICPSTVNTPMIFNETLYRTFRPELDNPGPADIEGILAATHPMGNPYIECEDISNLVLFLVSPAGRFLSGEVITVSAGAIARTDG